MTALSNIWGFDNPSSASPVYIRDLFTLSADVLAPNGTRPSAGTVLTKKTNKHACFLSNFAGFQWFRDAFAQRWRHPKWPWNSQGTPSANMENPSGLLYDTLRPRQNGYFADDFSNSFLVKENVLNFIENISGGLIDDTPALVQVRAWQIVWVLNHQQAQCCL